MSGEVIVSKSLGVKKLIFIFVITGTYIVVVSNNLLVTLVTQKIVVEGAD